MPNDLKSLKEKKIKEVIISQSPQKNSSHIRFPQFDRFLFLSHGGSFIVIFSPEKLAVLFLLTEFKPFPYCKLMINLVCIRCSCILLACNYPLKDLVMWQTGLNTVSREKQRQKKLAFHYIVSQLFNCRLCQLGSFNLLKPLKVSIYLSL